MKGISKGYCRIWKNIRKYNKRHKKSTNKLKKMTMVDFDRESILSFLNYIKNKNDQ